MSVVEQLSIQEVYSAILASSFEKSKKMPETPLKTYESIGYRLAEDEKRGFDEYRVRIEKGILYLADQGLFSKRAIDPLRVPILLSQVEKKNIRIRSFQEEFELSDEEMASCYDFAADLYTAQQYHEASDIFLVLTFLNPMISSFWIGLGMCEEMGKEYTSAVLAYLMALEVDQENLEPALHCAHCLYQCQETEKAALLLDQVITKAGDVKEYAEVKAQAIRMKQGRR